MFRKMHASEFSTIDNEYQTIKTVKQNLRNELPSISILLCIYPLMLRSRFDMDDRKLPSWEQGCDVLVPRSAWNADMPAALRRNGRGASEGSVPRRAWNEGDFPHNEI